MIVFKEMLSDPCIKSSHSNQTSQFVAIRRCYQRNANFSDVQVDQIFTTLREDIKIRSDLVSCIYFEIAQTVQCSNRITERKIDDEISEPVIVRR